WRGRRRGSALVRVRGRRGRLEPVGLVVDVGEFTQRRDVLAGVVRAEEQLAATVQGGPHVGLCAATVAPVGGTQGSGGQQSVHVVYLSFVSSVVSILVGLSRSCRV